MAGVKDAPNKQVIVGDFDGNGFDDFLCYKMEVALTFVLKITVIIQKMK